MNHPPEVQKNTVTIRELASRRDLKHFIYLPEKIHRNHKGWVHPLYRDEWVYFDPRKNVLFQHCKTILVLAIRGREVAGRAMGIINTQYNERHREKNARFSFLECVGDHEVAAALLGHIESWARENGMLRLVGPLGFSDKDPQGMLIEGFDEKVLIATNYNFPWMQGFLEQLGYSREIDLVSYKMKIPDHMPAYFEKVYQRVSRRTDLVVHEFTRKRDLRPWIEPIFELINEAYNHLYGFVPLTRDEMQEFADRYLPVLDPRFIKLITTPDNELLAFLISMPELSEGIRRARGRIFPVGWVHILLESRRTKLLTMLLGAIREPWRGKGLDTLMGMRLLVSAKKAGMEYMDSHLILETNARMRAEYERFNGILHKRFRIFGKDLHA
jgi:hypothetical protein